MKHLFTFVFVILLSGIFSLPHGWAQAPESFKYQAIARDVNGDILIDQLVSFQISILQGSVGGTSVYTETHSVTTNAFGLVSMNIGEGNTIDDMAMVDWANGPYFLLVEMDGSGGTNYQFIGVSQLLSVPYALHAKTAENVFSGDYNDLINQPTLQLSNDTLYLSGSSPLYLQNLSDTCQWNRSGDDLYYNNGTVGIGQVSSNGRLMIMSDTTMFADDVIFSVQNSSGDTVFAVYQQGVRVYIPLNAAKASGNRGGFAVGGFSQVKGPENEYFRVTEDSVRVYIKDQPVVKASGNRGGFAVGGFSQVKTLTDHYFNIEYTDTAEVISPSKPRMLWYPLKEAFLTGHVLIESSDSVGLNSFASGFESKAIGNWSQALGYSTRAAQTYATAIGHKAQARGYNSYSFGDSTFAIGAKSIALGSSSFARGINSVAFGSERTAAIGGYAGDYTIADGDYSFAVGMGARSIGRASVSLGVGTQTEGEFSSAIGVGSTAAGDYSAVLGFDNHIEFGSNYSLGIGSNNIVAAQNSMAVGFGNYVGGNTSMAIGQNAIADGNYCAALGFNVMATGTGSMAIGNGVSTENRNGAIIIGDNAGFTNSTADNQFMVRASGGFVLSADPGMFEFSTLYISPFEGNVGVGVANPERDLHIRDVMRLEPRFGAPSWPQAGDMYIDAADSNRLKVYDGTTWRACW